jgi:HlyD family secretion protein
MATTPTPLPASVRRRRWLLAAALAVVVVAVAIGVVALRAPEAPAVQVQAMPLVRTLQFSARVATLSRVDVGATITGRVRQVAVQEGAVVQPGQALVLLEEDELQAALRQAQATETQAQARIDGLRSTGRQAAVAAVAQAEATARNARAELARAEQLVAQGFVSASRVDEARRALDVATAQLQAAQAQVRANADGGTDLAQAQAQLVLARASTEAARAKLAQTRIVAPAAGRVLSRDVEPGQIVQAGRALLRLALVGPTQLEAQVDERFLDQLEVGQAATVVADAFPSQRLAARVLSIAPAVDAQRGAIEVKFTLQAEPPAFLREDMSVSVEVDTGRREQALAVPLAALRGNSAEGGASVLVVRDGRAVLQTVQLGLRTLAAAEVTQGLSAGDLVLMGAGVQAGQRLRPRIEPWQAAVTLPPPRTGTDAASALSNSMGR